MTVPDSLLQGKDLMQAAASPSIFGRIHYYKLN